MYEKNIWNGDRKLQAIMDRRRRKKKDYIKQTDRHIVITFNQERNERETQ